MISIEAISHKKFSCNKISKITLVKKSKAEIGRNQNHLKWHLTVDGNWVIFWGLSWEYCGKGIMKNLRRDEFLQYFPKQYTHIVLPAMLGWIDMFSHVSIRSTCRHLSLPVARVLCFSFYGYLHNHCNIIIIITISNVSAAFELHSIRTTYWEFLHAQQTLNWQSHLFY